MAAHWPRSSGQSLQGRWPEPGRMLHPLARPIAGHTPPASAFGHGTTLATRETPAKIIHSASCHGTIPLI